MLVQRGCSLGGDLQWGGLPLEATTAARALPGGGLHGNAGAATAAGPRQAAKHVCQVSVLHCTRKGLNTTTSLTTWAVL